MFARTLKSSLAVVGLGAALVCISFSPARADFTVERGWTLLESQPGTMVNLPGLGLTPFVGAPYGTFDFTRGTFGDFGRGIGAQSVFNTDTIVKRLDIADSPGGVPGTAPPIRLELVALQLRSAVPINLGAGTDFHYITLQSDRGGPLSLGNMSIVFGPEAIPHGTVDSFFDIFYDIRIGSPTGAILGSDVQRLTTNGMPWQHPPTPGALIMDDVNHELNNQNENQDLWPIGLVTGQMPNGSTFVGRVTPGDVPEPGSAAALGIGVAFAGGLWWRRRRAAEQSAPR